MSTDLFDLSGKTALVTGSARGIGLSLAEGLAVAGAAVIVNSRQMAAVEAAVEMLTGKDLRASAAAFDVADEAAVTAAFDDFDRRGGAVVRSTSSNAPTRRLRSA